MNILVLLDAILVKKENINFVSDEAQKNIYYCLFISLPRYNYEITYVDNVCKFWKYQKYASEVQLLFLEYIGILESIIFQLSFS